MYGISSVKWPIYIFILTTGIISEIGVKRVTQAGVYIDSRTFRSFEVFFFNNFIYFSVSNVKNGVEIHL